MALALTMCCGARMPFLLQYLINANIAIFIGEDLLALVRNESRPFRVRNSINEPTLKSKACLKCLYFTKIISDLCCYLEYFSYLYTIN